MNEKRLFVGMGVVNHRDLQMKINDIVEKKCNLPLLNEFKLELSDNVKIVI